MNNTTRTVLMILYYFPPAASGGTYRPLKFIRYLPEFGWRSVVIAPTECKFESRDHTLLREIPHGTEVIRVDPGVETSFSYLIWRKMGMGNYYERQFIPDRHIGFAENAISAAEERIKRGNIDLIFSSATPNSIHVAGRELAKSSKIPWVADFRDPWISCPFYNPANSTLDKKYREIEKSYFNHASAIISFPEYRADIERTRYPENARKILAIDNGFDPADFPDTIPVPQEDQLNITHVGAITKDRTVTIFLEALSKVLKSKNIPKDKIRLNFYGDARPPTPQDITRLGLNDITRFHGYVPHNEACVAMISSNILFMVLPNVKGAEGIMPLRLFEYIYSHRPVFLISPEGEASEFLKKTNSGIWVDYSDKKKIVEKLQELIEKTISGTSKHEPDLSSLKNHERKTLTEKLAQLFNRLVEGGSVPG